MKVFSKTIHVAAEATVWMPKVALQQALAREMGDLLAEALMDPEANPFSGLKLQTQQEFDPWLNAIVVSGRLLCDDMPVEYPAIRPPADNPMLTEDALRRELER